MSPCPVCASSADSNTQRDWIEFSCVRCGQFRVIPGNEENLQSYLGNWTDTSSIHKRSHLSYVIRRQQSPNGTPAQIFIHELAIMHLEDALPSPSEQADRLILWIGDHQQSQAEFLPVPLDLVSAWAGIPVAPANRHAGFHWLLGQPEIALMVEQGPPQPERIPSNPPHLPLRLRMQGWMRYKALKRAEVDSRTAFMAMKFGDGELNRVVEECFKPAVARAGFKLRVLTDRQPAGLIDDQLRVALRTSRFVVADLTHANNGAYWEAGFAEGLGRPVIYTCRKREWDDKEKRPHFDTNHLVTIIWNPGSLEEAGRRLTDTIRTTLPGEARMTD